MRALVALVVLLAVSVAEGASVKLTWTDNATNETGFDLERKAAACTAAGTFAIIGGVGANVTTFTDAFVTEGVTYCYRADAFNAAGKSAYSNLAEVPVPFSVPAAPTGLSGTIVP